MKIRNTILAVIAASTLETLPADEYSRFTVGMSNLGEIQGYLEVGAKGPRRIRVFPITQFHEISVSKGGDITLHFQVVQFPSNESANLRKKLKGNYVTNLDKVEVDSLQWDDLEVAVEVGGRQNLITRPFGGNRGTYQIKGTDYETIEALFDSGVILQSRYNIPTSSFSSIDLKIDYKSISNIKINAFKKVLRSSTIEEGGILFWKYRNEIINESTKAESKFKSSSNTSQSWDITLVDPTPAMEKRVDEFLSFQQAELKVVSQNHSNAAGSATEEGAKQIASLHSRYAEALRVKDIETQIDVLKAVASLSSGDILGFLANGVAFSSNSISGNQEAYISTSTSISSKVSASMKEFLLRSSHVSFGQSFSVSGNLFSKVYLMSVMDRIRNSPHVPGLFLTPGNAELQLTNIVLFKRDDVRLLIYLHQNGRFESDSTIPVFKDGKLVGLPALEAARNTGSPRWTQYLEYFGY